MAGRVSGRRKDREQSPRRREIIRLAARLFAQRGYLGTGMRDIADAAGILGGSLYHHFPSKDVLYLEAHGLALNEAGAKIREEIGRHDDPWNRLRAACITHAEIQCDPVSVTANLMSDLRFLSPDLQQLVIGQRDEFEQLYRDLVGDLPLPAEIDRSIYRILLLEQLNTIPSWYRAGRLTPSEIGAQIAQIFHHSQRA